MQGLKMRRIINNCIALDLTGNQETSHPFVRISLGYHKWRLFMAMIAMRYYCTKYTKMTYCIALFNLSVVNFKIVFRSIARARIPLFLQRPKIKY